MKTKAERIKALIDCDQTPFTAEDQARLEALTEEQLTQIEGQDRQGRIAALIAGTIGPKEVVKEVKVEVEKPLTALTEAEFEKIMPPSVKALVDRQKAQEAARKTALVTQLKTAQSEYTEAELQGMSIEALERTAKLVKLPAAAPVDFSGAAPRAAEQTESVDAPPDLGAAIRAAQKK